MNVGFLVPSVSRSAGGLSASASFLAQGLQKTRKCNVEIFGLRDEHTAQDISVWSGLTTNVTAVRGPRAFGYAPRLSGLLSRSGIDLLHSHGLWMYPSRASLNWARATHRPVVVTPHGMLDAWAVRNSRWKKRAVGWLYEDAHLQIAACIHALCDDELSAIRAYGLRNPVCVIPNGVDPPECSIDGVPDWSSRVHEGTRVLLYLGRIHPKKGLSNLLKAWQMAVQTNVDVQTWVMVIAGWDQGGHEAELKSLTRDLGIERSVLFVGPQFGRAKMQSYAYADAFVLPSVSEGLPMVILEAWAHGLPVLMTPQCNLPEGFGVGAGLQIGDDPHSIYVGLLDLIAMSKEQRDVIGSRGLKLIQQRFSREIIAEQMMAVYRWILYRDQRPGCVIVD